MTNRKAFVTDGTGFVGRHLIEELMDQEWHVIALHRASSNVEVLRNLGVELVEGALNDSEGLQSRIPEATDVVFHVAGDTSFWSQARKRQFEANVVGTRSIVAAALARGVRRFVHTSTVGVYGEQDGLVTEEYPQEAVSSWINYPRTKALAEVEVRNGIARGLDAVIVNPANILGPYDRDNWARIIRMVYEENLPGVPPGSGNFCHAREVARAHIAAAEHGTCGENYILGGPLATHLELIQLFSRILGKKIPDKASPAFLLKAVGRVSSWMSHLTRKEPDLTSEGAELVSMSQSFSSQRAVRELGYVEVELERMVNDCIDWMRSEKLLGT